MLFHSKLNAEGNMRINIKRGVNLSDNNKLQELHSVTNWHSGQKTDTGFFGDILPARDCHGLTPAPGPLSALGSLQEAPFPHGLTLGAPSLHFGLDPTLTVGSMLSLQLGQACCNLPPPWVLASGWEEYGGTEQGCQPQKCCYSMLRALLISLSVA